MPLVRLCFDVGRGAHEHGAKQTKAGVRYKTPKTKKRRNVRLSETVIEALKGWRIRQAEELLRVGQRPDGDTFVITQADGGPLQPRSLTHEWRRLPPNSRGPYQRLDKLAPDYCLLLG